MYLLVTKRYRHDNRLVTCNLLYCKCNNSHLLALVLMFLVVLAASVWMELFLEEDAGNREGTGYLSNAIKEVQVSVSMFVNLRI